MLELIKEFVDYNVYEVNHRLSAQNLNNYITGDDRRKLQATKI